MAERPYLDELRIKIERLRVKTFGNRYFIDPQELDGLLSGEVVRKAVKECLIPEHRRTKIADMILTKSKLTFAILVRMQREDLIPHFLDHGDFDSSLPQSKERILEIAPALQNGFTEEVQWEFLPHYFERDTRRIVRPEVVLPIVHEQQLADERGAFGTISKITITSTMQDLLHNGVSDVHTRRVNWKTNRI